MIETYILKVLIVTPLIGALLTSLIKKKEEIKKIGLMISFIPWIVSLIIWILFDNSLIGFQFTFITNWLVELKFGIDGISLYLILLTTFLTPICILIGWNSIYTQEKLYIIVFLIMEAAIIALFSVLDLIAFYVLFETILLPMFLIIGIWGSRERKIHAAYQFFLYTLLGSLFMLIGLIYMNNSSNTTDMEYHMINHYQGSTQYMLWLLTFLSFGVKVPMIPVHIWLPEAHVEAPTGGSVILAGVLLKLGTYGFLRISLTMFPLASIYFKPLIYLLSVIGIIYSSLTTIRQIDLKKIIAYSSVGHMGFITMGIFSGTMQGIEGGIISMISHGIVSSALFIMIGMLYDRHKTRVIKYFRGLVTMMPIFGLIKFILVLANISVPGTSSFVGEFLILIGTFESNKIVTILASTGIILGAVYGVWYYNRIMFGTVTNHITSFNDVTKRELMILIPFIVMILIIGIYPEIILEGIHVPTRKIIENLNV